MKTILFVSLILTTGCATLYERCSDSDEWRRYGSIDRCMNEKAASDRAIGEALQNWSRSMEQSQPKTCYTNGSTYGGYYSGTTTCY